MITPESTRIIGSTNRLVHLIYNLELSSTNYRRVSILTKIGLVIDSYQRLFANAIHIGNGLDLKVLALHLFRYAISEGYCCCDISKSILERSSLLHFGGHAVKLHGHRLAVLHVYVAKLNVAVIHCEGEIEIILIDRDTSVLLCVGIAIRAKHSNLYVCSTITIIINIHGALGSAHSFQPSSPVSIIALHLLGEMSIALFTRITSSPAPVVGTQNSIFHILSLITKDEHEVVPVAGTTKVSELDLVGLAWFSFDIVCKYSPPGCRIVGLT